MVIDFFEEVREFLTKSKLSTYCINAFLALQSSSNMMAKEISKNSGVPIGRIYEVLDELENKGMVKVNDSRPKTYSTIPFNRAIYNLINHSTKEDKRRETYLFEHAKILEEKLYSSEVKYKAEPAKIFYSTVIDPKKIGLMYFNSINESREEILMNGFINENSLKLIPIAEKMVKSIIDALDRGVQVKILMSFEYDHRPLSEGQKLEDQNLIAKIKNEFSNIGLTTKREEFNLRFTQKRFPNCYDIIDRKRVIMKLQNPSAPWQIFAFLNIVDPLLADELGKKYYNVWRFDTIP